MTVAYIMWPVEMISQVWVFHQSLSHSCLKESVYNSSLVCFFFFRRYANFTFNKNHGRKLMSNQNIVFSRASKIAKNRFSGDMLELGRSREVKISWLSPKFGIITLWTMERVGRSEFLMYDLNKRKKHNGQKDTSRLAGRSQTSRFKLLPIGSMYGIISIHLP